MRDVPTFDNESHFRDVLSDFLRFRKMTPTIGLWGDYRPVVVLRVEGKAKVGEKERSDIVLEGPRNFFLRGGHELNNRLYIECKLKFKADADQLSRYLKFGDVLFATPGTVFDTDGPYENQHFYGMTKPIWDLRKKVKNRTHRCGVLYGLPRVRDDQLVLGGYFDQTNVVIFEVV